MPELQHTFIHELGDPSNDGHGQTQSFVFKTNKTAKELDAINKSMKEKIGISARDICGEYENAILDYGVVKALMRAGIEIPYEEFKDEYEDDREEGEDLDDAADGLTYRMDANSVFKLWMNILQYLDPTFEYEIISLNIPLWNPYDSPGYGVFW